MKNNTLLASITAVMLTAGAASAAQAQEEKSGVSWMLDSILGSREPADKGVSDGSNGRGSDGASGIVRSSIY